jgi:hypothetical protein
VNIIGLWLAHSGFYKASSTWWCFGTIMAFFFMIIYNWKIHLKQFSQNYKIHFCSAFFLKCSVQQEQRPTDRRKFNSDFSHSFPSLDIFPSKLHLYQKPFCPQFSWQYIKVISWLSRQEKLLGCLFGIHWTLFHGTWLSPK